MGNAVISPACFKANPNSAVKLIFADGTTRLIPGAKKKKKRVVAGEFMFECPDSMVCHADSFFIGRPVPALGIHDELLRGQTYFVLPIDRFACNVLSASSLATLASSSSPTGQSQTSNNKPSSPIIDFGRAPFDYLKGSDGRALIKVSPEFLTSLITRDKENPSPNPSPSTSPSPSSTGSGGFLCSTPELQTNSSSGLKSSCGLRSSRRFPSIKSGFHRVDLWGWNGKLKKMGDR